MRGRERLRERDPELFRLVNTLKKNGVIYRNLSPQVFSDAVQRRDEIDDELESDDCYMRIVPENGLAMLSFYQDDEDYTNKLRRKLTTKEMKLYVTLLQIYNEKYVAEGLYVSTDIWEIITTWDKLGLNTKSMQANRSNLAPLIRTMKQHGFVAETAPTQYMLQPGLTFGLDIKALMENHGDVIEPWFKKEEEDAENKTVEKAPEAPDNQAVNTGTYGK